MGFLDRIRNLLSGPPRIQGDTADEAALQEEFGTPDAGEADVRRVEGSPGIGAGLHNTGYAASEAAETAEADLETEEAPPDPS